jgi:hypothetical protein
LFVSIAALQGHCKFKIFGTFRRRLGPKQHVEIGRELGAWAAQ